MQEEECLPPVTAVVLNWCGEEDTTDCLRSLRDSDYDGLDVLLVDNGSPDGSGERLAERFPDVSYLQTGENLGYGGGNNRGIAWARERDARYVMVLNNDTVVAPDAVRKLMKAVTSAPDVAGAAPTIVYDDAPSVVWYRGGHFSPLHGLGMHDGEGEAPDPSANGRLEDVTFLSGCACVLRTDVLDEVGGFREDFFAYVEDAELSLRLRKAGFRLLHVPGARVRHRTARLRSDPSPFQIVHRDRNRRRVMREHFGPLERGLFGVRFYATRVAHLARYLARGDLARVRAVVRGMTER